MKVTIQTTAPQEREIDWSKKMIVTDGEVYVQTTGAHDGGMCFTGFNISDSIWSSSWNKSVFTPCTTPITVTFENEL